MNWSQVHITAFLCVGISVKTNTIFAFLENISHTLGKLPRTTSGSRTRGWEPMY